MFNPNPQPLEESHVELHQSILELLDYNKNNPDKKIRLDNDTLSQWNGKNWIPLLDEKAPERNSPCTCGSGKKYKKCCGK